MFVFLVFFSVARRWPASDADVIVLIKIGACVAACGPVIYLQEWYVRRRTSRLTDARPTLENGPDTTVR